MLLIWVVVGALGSIAAAYLGVLGWMYAQQRTILYLPRGDAVAPGTAGLPGAEALRIGTADGERIVAWYVPPRKTQPLLLFFHGNAGCLADLAPRLRRLVEGGTGLLAIDYRGFGGSTGRPTESGLHQDADAAYGAAIARGVEPGRIMVLGESLGTGVAVALAARKPVAGLVLVAPFTSAMAVAALRYPLLPVRLLMHDRFRSDLLIGKVHAPLLVVHGTADDSIPIAMGRTLYSLAPGPKTFIAVEGGGHQVLELPRVMAQVEAWIASLYERAAAVQPPTREAPLRAT